MSGLLSAGLYLYVHILVDRVLELETTWENRSETGIIASNAVTQSLFSLGIGGIIAVHSDLDKQQRVRLLAMLKPHFRDAKKALNDYETNVAGTTAKQHISHILSAIEHYEHLLDVVDTTNTPETEWETDSAHLNRLLLHSAEAFDYLIQFQQQSNFEQRIKDEKEFQTIAEFAFYGVSIIFLIINVGGFFILFLYKITKSHVQLRETKNFLNEIIEFTPDALLVVNKRGRIIISNEQATSLFGYPEERLKEMTVEELLPERSRARHAGFRENFFQNPSPRTMQTGDYFVVLDSKLNEIPVEISLNHSNQHGESLALVALRNITERRQTQQKLELAQKVFEQTAGAILITDAENKIINTNDAFLTLFGYDKQDITGTKADAYFATDHNNESNENICYAVKQHGSWKGELWYKRSNGETFPSLVSVSGVRDTDGNITQYVSAYSDISSFKNNEKRLEQIAHFDSLTGIPNRILFYDRMRASYARARRNHTQFAILYIDLDGFKAINDNYGHAAGDDLLKTVSIRLQDCIREDDTVARLGGDEFAIVLNEVKVKKDLALVADRIIDAIGEPLNDNWHRLVVSASIGIATYPEDGDDYETVLKKADETMYQVKKNGKNGWRLHRDHAVA